MQRLGEREIGTDLDRHLVSTRRMAARLERQSPRWVARLATDDRTVADIAREVIEFSGWSLIRPAHAVVRSVVPTSGCPRLERGSPVARVAGGHGSRQVPWSVTRYVVP